MIYNFIGDNYLFKIVQSAKKYFKLSDLVFIIYNF